MKIRIEVRRTVPGGLSVFRHGTRNSDSMGRVRNGSGNQPGPGRQSSHAPRIMNTEGNGLNVQTSTFLLLTVILTTVPTGCAHTVHLPRVALERVDYRLRPADPVYCGPGGGGPVFAPPEVTNPRSCDPCSQCVQPSMPLQPVDPLGWLRAGDRGTQVVDPIGWMIGI